MAREQTWGQEIGDREYSLGLGYRAQVEKGQGLGMGYRGQGMGV